MRPQALDAPPGSPATCRPRLGSPRRLRSTLSNVGSALPRSRDPRAGAAGGTPGAGVRSPTLPSKSPLSRRQSRITRRQVGGSSRCPDGPSWEGSSRLGGPAPCSRRSSPTRAPGGAGRGGPALGAYGRVPRWKDWGGLTPRAPLIEFACPKKSAISMSSMLLPGLDVRRRTQERGIVLGGFAAAGRSAPRRGAASRSAGRVLAPATRSWPGDRLHNPPARPTGTNPAMVIHVTDGAAPRCGPRAAWRLQSSWEAMFPQGA